jgi:hypothetical protein
MPKPALIVNGRAVTDPVEISMVLHTQVQMLNNEYHMKWGALVKALEKHNPTLTKTYNKELARITGYSLQADLNAIKSSGNLAALKLHQEQMRAARQAAEDMGVLAEYEEGVRQKILETLGGDKGDNGDGVKTG